MSVAAKNALRPLWGLAWLACAVIALPVAAQSATAPAPRTLRVAFPVAETGFDPQATSDLYSDHVQRAIFETLYGFDYLARPYKRELVRWLKNRLA